MKNKFIDKSRNVLSNISLRILNPAKKASQFSAMTSAIVEGEHRLKLNQADIKDHILSAVTLYDLLQKKAQEGIMPNGCKQALTDLEKGLDVVTMFADGNDIRSASSQDLEAIAEKASQKMAKNPYREHEVKKELRHM